MASRNDSMQGGKSGPLIVSRTFPAARDLVFSAWSTAEHVKRWFCPAGYTVPQAEVEFKVGGAFNICMRSPGGEQHWTNGRFVEIVTNERLVIDMEPSAADRAPLFRAHTVVSFADVPTGTRMEVTQSYTLLDPLAAPMIQGAAQGWGQTLDRLEQEVTRIKSSASAQHSVVHATFCIERTYDSLPAQVYQALSDPAAKSKWFGGGEGFTVIAREMDVRPGGREHLKGRWASGMLSIFDAIYHDVVPNERIVYAYEMHLDERKISVSLATLEVKRTAAGTRLVMTEQGAFLDGYDDAGSRERGSKFLLEALAAFLKGDRGN
jgi:uncharacterized protein YndB with AHSA1/START domain